MHYQYINMIQHSYALMYFYTEVQLYKYRGTIWHLQILRLQVRASSYN